MRRDSVLVELGIGINRVGDEDKEKSDEKREGGNDSLPRRSWSRGWLGGIIAGLAYRLYDHKVVVCQVLCYRVLAYKFRRSLSCYSLQLFFQKPHLSCELTQQP